MTGPGWMITSFFVGALLFISSHAQAFVVTGRPSLTKTNNRLHGAVRGAASSPLHRTAKSRALCMSDGDREVIYDENGDINQDHVLDDYQKNPKGLAPGDVVTVCAEGLKFYHIRKFKADGLDPKGMVGVIKQLKLQSIKYPEDIWTANRPVFVEFLNPVKFKSHFEFQEVRRSTKEELDAFNAEQAKIDAEAAVKNAKLQADRAAKAAANTA